MAEFAISTTTLRSRLQSGKLPRAAAVAIAAEAGRALAQAHATGRIHGSLTSANILLQDSNPPRVTVEGFGPAGPTPGNPEDRPPGTPPGGPPTNARPLHS